MEIRTVLLEIILLLAVVLSAKVELFCFRKESQVSILRTTSTATGKIRMERRGGARKPWKSPAADSNLETWLIPELGQCICKPS